MIETVPSGTILHGHYRIERVLGSGGFGHVYLAMDLATNQQYALKEYLVTGANAQEQLKHEATVLSQLHNPNLPAFQDAFIERGRYYVVLNYIEGNDLTDLIRLARQRNEVVPIGQIMGWLLSICDAVMFLHAQQPPVIHRDIKPDNIRITSNGTAILVDLGNAKAAADGARTLFFIRHQGTPGYAPPEQYPGGSGTDTRSDVYALGGTLYFALTTHEPPSVSTRNQAVQQNLSDLLTLQEHVATNPPENNPEANALRQFRLGVTKPSKPAPRHSKHIAQLAELPAGLLNQLNHVIQRAMAIKPKDRYQYVADFANDLKQIVRALPPPSPTPSGPPPAPARPLDPNSTQPDLPMLYEAIQAAKEKANQGGTGTDNSSPSSAPATARPAQPTPPATVTSTCPRCHMPINAQSVFCSRCGTPLGGSPQNNASHAARSSHTDGADLTMVVTPPAQSRTATKASSYAPPATPGYSSPASPAGPSRQANYGGTQPGYNNGSSAMQTPSGQRQTNGQPPPTGRGKPLFSLFGFSIDSKMLLTLTIAFVVFLVIVALLIHVGHH